MAHELLSRGLGVAGQYRTYDIFKSNKSVYLKKRIIELSDETLVFQQPEKPRQPKKGVDRLREKKELRKN